MPQATVPKQLKPFTSESARIAARKRWDAPPPPPPLPPPQPIAIASDAFTDARLMRVRAQLTLIDAALEAQASKDTLDGKVLDQLASASARLSEQEFALAGRPKPGQRRPGPEKSARVGVFWGGTKPTPVHPVIESKDTNTGYKGS